ncbi:copia protein [Tanacetum coccineum]
MMLRLMFQPRLGVDKKRRDDQEFDIGFSKDQHVDETTQHHDWFQKPTKPPTPDRDWNKTLPAAHGPIQPLISNLAQKEDTRDSFNEPIDTPLDFLTFVMNRLKSLVELEYFLEEVYKATFDQFHWNNPEGQQYPHDLCKPLPLIPNSQGRRVIPFDHFINNVLAYLKGSTSSRTYATSVTKTKAADYGHAKWIEDLVPNSMSESTVPVIYDKYSLGHLITGSKSSAQFYGFAVNRYSNPMIQPEPEGSTQGYLLDSVEVLRFDTSAGNPVKEILPKLNLPDHRSILIDSKEFIKMDMERRSVKIKELQERCIIKAFLDHQIKKGNNIPMLQDVKSLLGKCFTMKDLGEAAYILGIKIYRDRSRRIIGLSQNAYIDKILKWFKMDASKYGLSSIVNLASGYVSHP